VNCSAPHYNLGAQKLRDWLSNHGYQIQYWDGDPGFFASGADLVCLSVIFSWDALTARRIALQVKDDSEVWCGGPGMYALEKWWKQETGLNCIRGLDWRFERQRGDYKMTFASRGCPVDCWFCIVPKIEGKSFNLDWDFRPASILCDNNLSALPVEFQKHIIRRYQETDTLLEDANSGFEPRTFDESTYQRWREILRGPWRFALDEVGELDDVERMMAILRDQRPDLKRVYVLIGNEPVAACQERVQKVIEWGGEPHCQPVLPLNALDREQFIVRHDWTVQKLKDFARWANRWIWRSVPLSKYQPRNGDRPFRHIA
jgi:hypothetical protein